MLILAIKTWIRFIKPAIMTVLVMIGVLQSAFCQQLIQHVTSAANTNSHITTLDYPSTNGKPDLVLIVSQNYGTYNANEIGVWYSAGKWKIFNQNRSAMPVATMFNVLVLDPSKQDNAFVHTVTPQNTKAHITVLDNALTNDREKAAVFITQHYGQYNTTPVGVWYSEGKWKIYNENRQPMPANTKFNVLVLKEGTIPPGWQNVTGNVFKHSVTEASRLKFPSKHVSYIDHASTNSKKNSYLFITQQFQRAYNTGVTGVWYDAPSWTIFNQDRKMLPDNVSFNVLSIENSSKRFVRPGALVSNPSVIKQSKNVKTTNWKTSAKIDRNKLFILPYKEPATESTSEPAASSTEMQGPNIAIGKDINGLFTDAGFDQFVNKLNVFREIYEDKNPASGYFYYLPKNYNLKWNRETGQYSFYIYYLSADKDAKGEVVVTAELTPNINRDDITLAEALLSKKLNKEVKLRPLPLKDTPKVSFGNSLSNFDVKDESVSTNVPADFLEPIVVSWKMDKRVDDFLGAMMNNIGITGSIEFSPHHEGDKIIAIPVKLKVNDDQTFGKMEYSEAASFLNGFYNPLDYPLVLKELIVLRKKTTNDYSIEKILFNNYEVQPQSIFSSFTPTEKNTVLNGNVISKMWVQYSIKPCDECNKSVQSKIMGGTSNSRVKSIELQVLTPLEYSGANSIKLMIKSKQGDPNGKSDVLLPIITIDKDNQTLTGGDLFISEGDEPNYQYQLVVIQPDGSTLMSNWIDSKDLFIILGESTIKENFQTEESPATDEHKETDGN